MDIKIVEGNLCEGIYVNNILSYCGSVVEVENLMMAISNEIKERGSIDSFSYEYFDCYQYSDSHDTFPEEFDMKIVDILIGD